MVGLTAGRACLLKLWIRKLKVRVGRLSQDAKRGWILLTVCFEIDLLGRRAGEVRGPSFGADAADLWGGGGGRCVLCASIAFVALVKRLELSGRAWTISRL